MVPQTTSSSIPGSWLECGTQTDCIATCISAPSPGDSCAPESLGPAEVAGAGWRGEARSEGGELGRMPAAWGTDGLVSD